MLKIEFPLKTKNPVNGSWGHWSKHSSAAKKHRDATRLALLASGAKKPGPIFVVRLTRISPGTLDDDNLRPTLKAVRDAVANWLGVDDGGPLVRWEYQQEKGEAGVRVEIKNIGYEAEIDARAAEAKERLDSVLRRMMAETQRDLSALPGGDE